MEVVQLTAKNSQGVCQRVFIELVRRKVEVESALIGKKNDHIIMILGIDNLPGKEKILYVLKAIPDVIAAEYLDGGVKCRWETIPHNGSTFEIIKSGKNEQKVSF